MLGSRGDAGEDSRFLSGIAFAGLRPASSGPLTTCSATLQAVRARLIVAPLPQSVVELTLPDPAAARSLGCCVGLVDIPQGGPVAAPVRFWTPAYVGRRAHPRALSSGPPALASSTIARVASSGNLPGAANICNRGVHLWPAREVRCVRPNRVLGWCHCVRYRRRNRPAPPAL